MKKMLVVPLGVAQFVRAGGAGAGLDLFVVREAVRDFYHLGIAAKLLKEQVGKFYICS
jgi:hypothetical protein